MTDASEWLYFDGDLTAEDFPFVRGVWIDTKYVNEPPLQYIRADLYTALQAQLATCEKYKAAYAECDRIGTQVVRDLEARLAEVEGALRKIADTDPDEGTAWFHDVANAALAAMEKRE